jgi:tetratricopeptide (TPR) repeat protein
MMTHPPDPLQVHRLPRAPHFVGRQPELEELLSHWGSGTGSIVGLVGLGGAGKTAIAARFLDQVLHAEMQRRPNALFVWSFYQEPDSEQFLRTAYEYFAGESSAAAARGVALVHLLNESLACNGPHLIVLDGLERVQRAESDGAGAHGQIEDPLLKHLLLTLAEHDETMVLITTRFPLSDLEAARRAASDRGARYHAIEVGGLSVEAGISLLRARGVHGEDAELEALVAGYGAHALTLDHLGGLIGQFLGGDPRRAPEAPAFSAPGVDRQAFRLARLLRAYEEHLPPAELALLCRLCLLRRSATVEQITAMFLCSPGIRARTVRTLPEDIRAALGGKLFTAHALRDLADAIRMATEDALAHAPLAGPEDEFVRQLIAAVESFVELRETAVEVRIADLAALYLRDYTETVTDRRPLPAQDRRRLREFCSRYLTLAQHPLMKGAPAPALQKAFQDLGYSKSPREKLIEDYHPADLQDAFKRVQECLCQLTFKHLALCRTREVCRLAQRKWALAGPLAPLDRAELLGVLESLVSRHLVLRETDGSFSVHPAVRDHFARLGSTTERGDWHDIIREQLITLMQRPGMQRPSAPATLDLVEEAIYHTLQAGRTDDAVDLYENVLGGLRHLGWKLGEIARGVRILRGFPDCPDKWALGWFLRALGEYEEALALHPLPCFRADIRLLQGRLPHVAAEGDETRTASAAFLMGQASGLPPDRLGCAVPRAQLLLYRGQLKRVRQSWQQIVLYQDIGWEGERARCQLFLSDAYRRQGDLTRPQGHLAKASNWILHSGSVEHLCLMHLMQTRLARSENDGEAAQRAIDAGIRLARQCGLGLYLIDMLCEQAELCLNRADAPAAEHFAAAALERAESPDCQFLWGATLAGNLLGWALLKQGKAHQARPFLKQAVARCLHLGDPNLEHAQRLLKWAEQ